MKPSLLCVVFAIIFATMPPIAVAAYQEGSGPFALGHQTGVEVPRMYSGRFRLSADDFDKTTYILRTENTSSNGDPVMLALDDDTGEPLGMSDDHGFLPPFDKNPKINIEIAAAEDSLWVNIVVASFDEAYAGQTDFVIYKTVEGQSTQEYKRISAIRFGSIRIDASWEQGDVVRAVGHYESETIQTACETELGGEWDFVDKKCVSEGSTFYPAAICELAYPNRGLRFNAVYPHGSRCEKTTHAKDTMIMAAEGWTKSRYTRCIGPCSPIADRGGFDDNSGAGTTAKLVMPSTSTVTSPVIVVGLHPWSDFYDPAAYYGNSISSPVEADKIRIYRDRAITSNNDPDNDGLSTELENAIGLMPFGLDPNSADTSQDGIIDGLAVYGSDDLPLPNLGVVAEQKNIVVEVDHIVGMELNSNRRAAIQATGYALDEVGLNFIGLTGEYATYSVTSCGLECHRVGGRMVCETVCEDIEVPVVSPSNVTSTIPAAKVSPTRHCNTDCAREPNSGFDLIEFPFVRRMAWTNIDQYCGWAEGRTTSGIGRYGVVRCADTTFVHELGHMLGLGHGGRHDNRPNKPNYWSVMSYGVDLPLPKYKEYGYTPMFTKETSDLTGTRSLPARFSNTYFTTVNENALIEEAGITGGHCLNQDCSDYSAPYVFESVRDPRYTTSVWLDIAVNWLDWELDGEINPNPVIKNIDRQCEENIVTGIWTNKNTNETGISEAVCRETLQPKNDHDFLKYEMHAYDWTICQNFDAQRAKLGLNAITNCTIPFHLPPVDQIGCE